MEPDETIRKAIKALAEARSSFHEAVEEGLILGNDNHIGDIGEYWVKNIWKVFQNSTGTPQRKILRMISK